MAFGPNGWFVSYTNLAYKNEKEKEREKKKAIQAAYFTLVIITE
jgi:hypothetical protein